jgi:hypothetical protein
MRLPEGGWGWASLYMMLSLLCLLILTLTMFMTMWVEMKMLVRMVFIGIARWRGFAGAILINFARVSFSLVTAISPHLLLFANRLPMINPWEYKFQRELRESHCLWRRLNGDYEFTGWATWKKYLDALGPRTPEELIEDSKDVDGLSSALNNYFSRVVALHGACPTPTVRPSPQNDCAVAWLQELKAVIVIHSGRSSKKIIRKVLEMHGVSPRLSGTGESLGLWRLWWSAISSTCGRALLQGDI